MIGMTHEQAVRLFQQRFGGDVYVLERNLDRWRPLWRWRVSSRAAAEFLRAILPWLIVKRQQALVGLELADRIAVLPTNQPHSADEVAAREAIRLRLVALNKKGPFSPTG
jgi:hypothetical protein